MDEGRFHTVARVGEVVEGIGWPAEVEERAIAVFLVDGAYFAVDDSCPHQGFPLNDGAVVDRTVTCLYHGWRFGLEDGCWVDNPGICVATHAVRVVGDEVQVAIVERD